MQFLTALSTLLCLAVAVSAVPATNSNKNFSEMIKEERDITYAGSFYNTETHTLKHYYLESTQYNWAGAKKRCEDLLMEPVSIQNVAERQYLSSLNLPGTYFWTAGVQTHDFVWNFPGGSAIAPAIRSWCSAPPAAICLALHKGALLHSLSCDSAQFALCERVE